MSPEDLASAKRSVYGVAVRQIRDGKIFSKEEIDKLIKYFASIEEYEICQELNLYNG